MSKVLMRRGVQFYISLIIFMLFSNGFNNVISSSSDYFDAHPSVQIKGGYVNITYTSTNLTGINLVQVIIVDPDNDSETHDMTFETNKYVYNHIYETMGKYTFHIVTEDTSGDKSETTNKTFWITNDVDDVDNDGMPDWWEEKYGFDRYNPVDADTDEDKDGYTNREEYETDMNPLTQASFMQNAQHRLTNDWPYLIISLLLFMIVIILSFYGLMRRR